MFTQLTDLKAFRTPGFRRQQHTCRSRIAAAGRSSTLAPHSGYHYDDSGRRFFEGWYFKARSWF